MTDGQEGDYDDFVVQQHDPGRILPMLGEIGLTAPGLLEPCEDCGRPCLRGVTPL